MLINLIQKHTTLATFVHKTGESNLNNDIRIVIMFEEITASTTEGSLQRYPNPSQAFTKTVASLLVYFY